MEYINIRSFDNYIPAHIAAGRLEEEGINCWLKDENTVTIDPILTNAIGGIKLMVDPRQAERAADILRKLESEHRKLTPCTKCQSLNIDYVSTPRKAGNWFSAILGFITFSFAMPVEKVFHCFDCGHEFTEKQNTAEEINN